MFDAMRTFLARPADRRRDRSTERPKPRRSIYLESESLEARGCPGPQGVTTTVAVTDPLYLVGTPQVVIE
jgi:hypothetical protein